MQRLDEGVIPKRTPSFDCKGSQSGSAFFRQVTNLRLRGWQPYVYRPDKLTYNGKTLHAHWKHLSFRLGVGTSRETADIWHCQISEISEISDIGVSCQHLLMMGASTKSATISLDCFFRSTRPTFCIVAGFLNLDSRYHGFTATLAWLKLRNKKEHDPQG